MAAWPTYQVVVGNTPIKVTTQATVASQAATSSGASCSSSPLKGAAP